MKRCFVLLSSIAFFCCVLTVSANANYYNQEELGNNIELTNKITLYTNKSDSLCIKLDGGDGHLNDVPGPNGNIRRLIPNRTEVCGVSFAARSYDGYRYIYLTYDGYSGYIKYDPYKMDTYGIGHRLYVNLFASAARIRAGLPGTAQYNTIRTTVSNGTEWSIQVYQVTEEKYAGYRWMWVSYGNYVGWMQYDPFVMYLAHSAQ